MAAPAKKMPKKAKAVPAAAPGTAVVPVTGTAVKRTTLTRGNGKGSGKSS